MTKSEFHQKLIEAKQQRPKVFGSTTPDPLASDDQIDTLENIIGCKLEGSHREFLQEFGGGDFGFGVLFCANPESEWFLVSHLNQRSRDLSFIPVSDDFAGGVYGFLAKNGRCEPPLLVLDHESGDLIKTDFHNVFDFMDRYALRPA
ncbi:SMI1/KNR4 family protein [Luteolibacter sp. LG18]|uniref:SMI1/KNR4 family protein n=1 Tax=Luteolibacter sp. LG18 TaxID=2819286 RepID=UPI002B30E6D2|nr:hypothetical protein llg_27840 [Luteolibacter sp. LG18]